MEIFTKLKKFNLVPAFQDEEQNRIAGIITITALATLTGLCLLLFQRLVFGKMSNILPLIFSSILLILSIVLNNYKRLSWAGSLLLWTLLGFLFTMVIKNDGLHDSAIIAYPGLFVLAGLILNRNHYIFFSLASLLTIIIVGIWEIKGVLVNSLSYKTHYIDIIDLTVILGITSIVIRLLADNILNSLKLAYKREKNLIDQATQLKISEERFRQVVETVPNGITIVNKEGKIIFANNTSENILGLEKSKITERNYNDPEWKITTLDSEPFPEEELPFNVVKRTSKPLYGLQHVIDKKDKGNIVLSINAAPLFDENGNFDGMIAALENITERKNAEIATKAAKEYAENLIETSNTIVVGLNLNGKINVFNKAAEEITGYRREDLENNNWFEVLVPIEKYPEVWNEFNRISQGGLPREFENPILTKSGEERQIVWSNSQVIEHGQITGTISFGLDITERKKAEEALKESEEHFRKFIENASVGACLVGLDNKFINVNKTMCDLVGYSEEELKEKTFNEITYFEDRDAGSEYVSRVLSGDINKFTFEKRYVNKDGHLVWGLVSSSLIKDIKGNPKYFVTHVQDITERKYAEEALRLSEEKFSKVFQSSPMAITLSRVKDGLLFEINDSATKLFGFNRSEAIGQSTIDLNVWAEPNDRELYIKELMANGSVRNMEFNMYCKDGRKIITQLSAEIIEIDKEKWILTTILDITLQKSMEDALRSNEDRYRRLVESVTDYIYSVRLESGKPIETIHGPGCLGVTGYTSEEFESDPHLWYKMIYDEDKMKVDELLNKIILGKDIQPVEHRIIHKDSSVRWIRNTPVLQYDNEGVLISYEGLISDITERKLAEEKLRQGEQEFRWLIENSVDALYRGDYKTWEYDYISPSIKDILGFTPEEMKELKQPGVAQRILPEDREKLFLIIESLKLSKGGPYNLEYSVYHKDGTIRRLHEVGTAISDSDGRLLYGIGSVRDITERKNAEEILRESEEQFRSLAEQSPNMIFINCRGKIVYANEQCEKIMGYTKAEFYSDNFDFKVLVDSTNINSISENFKKHLNGEDLPPYEYSLISKNNERFDVILASKLINYKGQRAILGIVTDVTERKQMEEALRESEQRLKNLNEASFEGIAFSDNGILIDANEQLAQMLGYTRSQIIGKPVAKFIAEDSQELVQRMHLTGNTGPYEHWARRSDGVKFPVEVRARVITLDDRQYRVSIIRDITESKKAEEALRESEERYRNLYENAPIGIYRTTPDGRIMLCNQRLLDMLGFNTLNELKKRNLDEEGFQPSYPREIFKNFMDKNGEVRGLEAAWFKKDGSTIYVRENAKAIKDNDGKIIYYDGMVEDITERKITEEALKQSEEKMRAIVEGTPHLFFYVQDSKANTTYVSPTVEQITGYKPKIWLKRKDWFVTNAKINKIAKRKTHSHLNGAFDGKPVLLEVQHANGNPILLEAYEYPIIQNNKVIGLQGVAHDITERKKTEEVLREREKDYKELIDGMNETVWIIGLDGNIIDVNKTATSLLGYSKDELLKVGLKGIDSSLTKREIQSLVFNMPKDKFQIFETSHKTKDGRTIPVEVVSSIITYRGKETILSIARDITERKKAEEALRESENTLRVFINAIPEASLLIDTEGNIVAANQALAEGLGENTETIINKNLYKTLPSKIARTRKAKIIEAIKNNKAVSFEDYHTGHYYYNYVNPVLDDSNKVSKIAIIGFDITERKNSELELDNYRQHLEELIKERTRELEQVNTLLQEEVVKQKEAEEKVRLSLEKERELSELKSKFISIASHEFRTPLTTVLSSTELLERYGRTWEHDKYIKQTERIRKSVKYLTNLLDEVLIISRADTGKIKFEPKKIDLEKFGNNILEDIKLILTNKHSINFEININQKNYMLDEKLLKFIILNLLSNAVKYSPKGGEIGFKIHSNHDKLIFEISDEGMGIPEEDRIHLFDPFNRGSNIGDIHGTGLGMSIVKRSVEMYNGLIDYESEIGKGTKFIVSLPINNE